MDETVREVRFGASQNVYRKPFIGWAMVLVGACAGVAAAVLASVLGVMEAGLLIAVGLVVAGSLGYLHARYWRQWGRSAYLAGPKGISVVKGDVTVSEWQWDEINKVTISGRFAWYELLVAQPVSAFPRLVVYTSQGRHEALPVLLWGADADVADEQIQELLRTSKSPS